VCECSVKGLLLWTHSTCVLACCVSRGASGSRQPPQAGLPKQLGSTTHAFVAAPMLWRSGSIATCDCDFLFVTPPAVSCVAWACGNDRQGVAAFAEYAGTTKHDTVSCFCWYNPRVRASRISGHFLEAGRLRNHNRRNCRAQPARCVQSVASPACTTLVLRHPLVPWGPRQYVAGPGLPSAKWSCPRSQCALCIAVSVWLANSGWRPARWLILPAG
jgi:hypothetical protein